MAMDKVIPVKDRRDENGDWIVRQMISASDLALSPEEYAARNAHHWACFSFHRFRFEDANLATWVAWLGEILDSEEELERCRQRLLTPEELANVRRQSAEGF